MRSSSAIVAALIAIALVVTFDALRPTDESPHELPDTREKRTHSEPIPAPGRTPVVEARLPPTESLQRMLLQIACFEERRAHAVFQELHRAVLCEEFTTRVVQEAALDWLVADLRHERRLANVQLTYLCFTGLPSARAAPADLREPISAYIGSESPTQPHRDEQGLLSAWLDVQTHEDIADRAVSLAGAATPRAIHQALAELFASRPAYAELVALEALDELLRRSPDRAKLGAVIRCLLDHVDALRCVPAILACVDTASFASASHRAGNVVGLCLQDCMAGREPSLAHDAAALVSSRMRDSALRLASSGTWPGGSGVALTIMLAGAPRDDAQVKGALASLAATSDHPDVRRSAVVSLGSLCTPAELAGLSNPSYSEPATESESLDAAAIFSALSNASDATSANRAMVEFARRHLEYQARNPHSVQLQDLLLRRLSGEAIADLRDTVANIAEDYSNPGLATAARRALERAAR